MRTGGTSISGNLGMTIRKSQFSRDTFGVHFWSQLWPKRGVPIHLQLRVGMLVPNPTLAHIQITHPNNIIYLLPEDEPKHSLYAASLTLGFRI